MGNPGWSIFYQPWFRRRNHRLMRFRAVIPVPDSVREEAILINILTSRGDLKGEGVLIYS